MLKIQMLEERQQNLAYAYGVFLFSKAGLPQDEFRALREERIRRAVTEFAEQAALTEAVATPLSFDVAKDEYGKPYFTSLPLYLSISHTKNIEGIAIGAVPVGMDLEEERSINKDRVAGRVFHEEEKLALAQGNFTFTELWCAKESYSKLIGLGLQSDFPSWSTLTADADIICGEFACPLIDDKKLTLAVATGVSQNQGYVKMFS